MSGVIVGIDPGLTGAVGVINTQGEFVAAWDLPVMRDQSLAWIDATQLRDQFLKLREILSPGATIRFVVERVSAMPKQGVSGVFTFGVTFGSILATVQSFGYPLELVTPVKWKNALGLRGKSGAVGAAKRAALDRARLLFPAAELTLIKHEARAEALLIAHWALRHQTPERVAA